MGLLAILAVGWLAIGAISGGLLLPPVLGVLGLLAAGWILGRPD